MEKTHKGPTSERGLSGSPWISSVEVSSISVVGEVSPAVIEVSVGGGEVGAEVEHAAAKMHKMAIRRTFMIFGFIFFIRLAP